MAPEQLRGKPRQASDQYSLGIVVYEWLTGERPFNGSFSEVASQHIFEPPPPIHEKLPSVSPAVEEVVMTALAKDPHQRFGSVRSFANALEQASKVMSSFPGMGLLSQLPAVPPAPVNPAQGSQQSSVSPDRTVSAQPAYPDSEPPLHPVYPDTAQPAQANSQQQPSANTNFPAQTQSDYFQPISEQAEAAHNQHFTPPPPSQLPPTMPAPQQKEAASDQYSVPYSQPGAQPLPAKRRTGLIIGIVLLLLLVVGGGIGAYYYINQSTPEKTLSAVCTAVTNNDPQGFFNLLSSHTQSQTTEANIAQQFQQFQSSQVGGIKSCTFSNVQQSGSNATAVVTLTPGNISVKPAQFKYTLVNENGTWKVDSTASA
jgi:hypothetical protein